MKKPFSELRDPETLRFHLEGMDATDGNVHLGAFVEKLSALKAALSEASHLQAGSKAPDVDFLVTDLSHRSPAMVEILPVSYPDANRQAGLVADWFLGFLQGIKSRKIPIDPTYARIVGHLRRLVGGIGERFSRIWIDGRGRGPISLGVDVATALDDVLPDVRKEFGAVKGMVKKYIGVGARPYFKLIPPAGGVEIKCIFPPSLLELAASTVEHNATIEGELKCYEDELWPFEIRVNRIEIHPPDNELPTLVSLAGINPEATGEMSAAEFVRGLRNEW